MRAPLANSEDTPTRALNVSSKTFGSIPKAAML